MRLDKGIILCLICTLFGAAISWMVQKSHPQVVVDTQIDSVIVTIKDTERIREVVLRESVVLDTVTEYVILRDTDTVYIALPIEQKHYAGSDYEAWVSGYMPALDSLFVFPETKIITKTITNTIRPNKNAVFLSSEAWVSKYSSLVFMSGYGLNLGSYGQIEASLGYEVFSKTPVASVRYRKDIITWQNHAQK